MEVYAVRGKISTEIRGCQLLPELALVDFGPTAVHAGLYIYCVDCVQEICGIFSGVCVYRFNLLEFLQQMRSGKREGSENNRQIVTKVYIPKFLLVVQKMLVNGFKMVISFGLVIIMMVIYQVPVTWKILYFFPLMLVLVLLTFGISNIMLHFGVFVDDLQNVMTVVLRLIFYMSGIFYSIGQTVPEPYQTILLKCNPMAFIMDSLRRCMLYSQLPGRKMLIIWGVIGLILSVISVKLVYKYENSYVKVI